MNVLLFIIFHFQFSIGIRLALCPSIICAHLRNLWFFSIFHYRGATATCALTVLSLFTPSGVVNLEFSSRTPCAL